MAGMPSPSPGIYARLKADPFQIRLLQIEGDCRFNPDRDEITIRLQTFEFEDEHMPKYHALSYCWGRQEWWPIWIRVNDEEERRRMYVSKNCRAFIIRTLLKRSPLTNPRYPKGWLWIDSICIWQHDEIEKTQIQVPQMGAIYAKAEQVIAWLGWHYDVDGNGEDRAMAMHNSGGFDGGHAPRYVLQISTALQNWIGRGGRPWSGQLSQYSFGDDGMYNMLRLPEASEALWAQVAMFLFRQWFRRAWVLQEAVLARELDLFCGWDSLTWNDILHTVVFLHASGWFHRLMQLLQLPNPNMLEVALGYQVLIFDSLRRHLHPGQDTLNIATHEISSLELARMYDMLQIMITKTRRFGATENKDKILAPLAFVRQVQRSHYPGESIPQPSQDLTTVGLYTHVSSEILRHCDSLFLLSHVEDRTLRTDATDLPSWVPDFTQTLIAPFADIPNVSFDALLGRPKQCSVDESGRVLTLNGCKLGTIAKVTQPFSDLMVKKDLSELLDLCLMLDIRYVNGQDRVEALWRTLIANCDGDACPAAANVALQFKQFLLVLAAVALYGSNRRRGVCPLQDPHCWQVFNRLHGITTYAAYALPDSNELSSFAERWRQILLQNLPFQLSRTETRQSEPYGLALGRVYSNRRVFVTREKQIGLGPVSLLPDDEVWCLSGAKVPFVLRPLSKDTESRLFEIVGETYIHGYMHGEIYGVDPTFEDIYIA